MSKGDSGASIPLELYISIFMHVDFKTLLTCRKVNTTFRNVVDGDPRLQYIIELAIDRQIDVPRNTCAVGERVRLLRSRRDFWANLNLKSPTLFRFESKRLYAYAGGILVGSRLSYPEKLDILYLRQSDGETRSLSMERGHQVLGVALEPSRDLIVVAEASKGELRLSPVSLKNAPEAYAGAAARLVAKASPSKVHIFIAEDTILASYTDDRRLKVVIWDMKTGIILAKGNFLKGILERPSRVTLLLPNIFMLIAPHPILSSQYCVNLFSIPPVPTASIPALKLLLSLELPRLNGEIIRDIKLVSSPYPSSASQSIQFPTQPKARLYAIHFLPAAGGALQYSPAIIISSDRLLEIAKEHQVIDDGYNPIPRDNKSLGWQSWGLENTSVIDCMIPRDEDSLHQPLYGERGLFLRQGADGRPTISVLDFNLPRWKYRSERRISSSVEAGPGALSSGINTELTRQIVPAYFGDDVLKSQTFDYRQVTLSDPGIPADAALRRPSFGLEDTCLSQICTWKTKHKTKIEIYHYAAND